MRIYTRKGDDGTTGLFHGGRVRKDAPAMEANGAVDEAQVALGMARAEAERGTELSELIVDLERDLWVLMAEVATAPESRGKLKPGQTLVTREMIVALEKRIDDLSERFEMPAEFVLHSLRHTYGTRLGEAGADAFSIMRLMGHSSVTVSQRYVHPTPEALERAVKRLERLNQKAQAALPGSPNLQLPTTVSATVEGAVAVSH